MKQQNQPQKIYGRETIHEWKKVRIQDVAHRITSGGTPSTKISEYYGGRIPWLNTQEINFRPITGTKQFLTEFGLANSSAKWIEPNSIIIAMYGATAGKSAISKIRLTTNQACCNITIDDVKADFRFIYYAIVDAYNELENLASGAAQQNLNVTIISNFEIPLPPLAEQRAIAEVLSSLDDKIDLLHRQNKTLESLAETLFRQWFIEQAKPDWKEGTIADLIDFNPPRKLSKKTNAPYLEMAELNSNTFNPDGWYMREFSSGTKFINGDTLLARITPCLENGKTAYITFLDEGQVAWGSTEYIVMRSKSELHPFFAYTLARNNDFRDYAEGCLEGSSGRQRVNVDHLKNYNFLIPDELAIRQFNEFSKSTVPKLHANAKQVNTLETLRDTLLSKLMSGEVQVSTQSVSSNHLQHSI